jgi:hypothetical protein
MMVYSERPAAPRSSFRFRNPDEARAFAVARVLAAERIAPGADVYASTWWRSLGEGVGPEFLVHEPARELELAEAFSEQGFHREAFFHYENLLTYHAGSAEARVAARRIEASRRRTLRALVAPDGVIGESGGEILVARSPEARLPETAELGRFLAEIHRPYLSPAPAGIPDGVIGHVDDDGRLRTGPPFFRPSPEERPWFRLPQGCAALPEAEREAKRAILEGHLEGLSPDSPLQARAIEALVYLGFVDEARRRAELRDGSLPENPLAGELRPIADDPAHPLALDARRLLRARGRAEEPAAIRR